MRGRALGTSASVSWALRAAQGGWRDTTADPLLNVLPHTRVTVYVRKCPVNGISIGKGYEPSPRTLKVRLAQTSESLCRSSNLPKGTGPLGGCPGASRDTLLCPCFVIPGSVGVRLGARRKRGLRYPLSLPCTLCKRTQTEFPCTRKWTPVLHLLCTFLVRTFRLFNPLILHL